MRLSEIEENKTISLNQVHELRHIRQKPSKKAIYALPEGYRIVLSLILLEGYDHEEVSEILNISNATSRTQYHRAKKKVT